MIHRLKTLFIGAALVTPSLAFAHSPIKGINNFYNGVLHPALVPPQLTLLIAMGLYLGQRDVSQNQKPVMSFLVAAIAGLVVAGFSSGFELQVLMLGTTIVVGILVAADLALKRHWRIAMAALAGLLLGLDSTQETLSGMPKWVTLFGCLIGIALLLMFPMALADYCRSKEWQRIGVRVIGSWLVAAAVMAFPL